MIEQLDLGRLERDVYRDYFQDGLVEMLTGAYLLLIGLGLPIGGAVPFFLFLLLGYARLLRALKTRLVHPRTGYVELREGDPQPLPQFVLGSLVLSLVALVATLIVVGVIARPAMWYRWMPILFGIWLAGIWLGLGLRIGLLRYYLLACVALIAGLAIPFVSLDEKLGHLGLLLAVVGATALIGGGITLLRYLHHHPRLPKEDDDVPQ